MTATTAGAATIRARPGGFLHDLGSVSIRALKLISRAARISLMMRYTLVLVRP